MSISLVDSFDCENFWEYHIGIGLEIFQKFLSFPIEKLTQLKRKYNSNPIYRVSINKYIYINYNNNIFPKLESFQNI